MIGKYLKKQGKILTDVIHEVFLNKAPGTRGFLLFSDLI
jgi:hypothetical protein